MKKRLSLPLLVGAALLAFLLVGEPPQIIQDSTTPSPQEGIPTPQSYAMGVQVDTFDENGMLRDRTQADLLQRFPGPAVVELEQPRRWHFADDGPWFARADTGKLLERKDQLLLREQVRLSYESKNVEFRTERMVLDLAQRKARSETPAEGWQGDNVMYGERLYVDLDRQVATLSQGVRTTYVPE